MSKVDNSVDYIWENYLKSLGENRNNTAKQYSTWYFGSNKKEADELAELVKKGTKRGTTSLYYWYENEKEPLPLPGEYSVIVNWEGEAQCIIKTTKVTLLAFKDVTEELAKIEGEGDKSLEHWRDVHIRFFTEEMKDEVKQFTEDMIVVFEEFELVF